MPILDSADLRDPRPPVPGARERALVARRARELGRRRHLLQGGGALTVVAAVAVGVAALTAGGVSSGGTSGVDAAGSGADPAPSLPTDAAATTFTLSGTVVGNPADTHVVLDLDGPEGRRRATADSTGHFSVRGVTAGDYRVVGRWVDASGTAGRAERFGSVTVGADTSVSFTFAG